MAAIIYTDGASRGNPGRSGAGASIRIDHGPRVSMRKYLGVTTNNVAEYEALLMALRFATAFGLEDVKVFTDSKLMAEQVAARWVVYDTELIRLRLQAQELIGQLSSFSIKHIPREKNKRADRLANAAINEVVENG